MATRRKRTRRKKHPITEAFEPRCYDRRFYAGALLAGAVLIVVSAAFLVYGVYVRKDVISPGPSVDLRSVLVRGRPLPPDPSNPAIAMQSHLEALREGDAGSAYDDLSSGLKEQVPVVEFEKNARENALLLKNIKAYDFPDYTVNGNSAGVTGYILYKGGGRTRVDAAMSREDGRWKIARMTMVYQ